MTIPVAVAFRLRSIAQQLAAQINEGEYAALTPEQRCELAGVPMALLEQADILDPDRAVQPVPAGEIVQFPTRIPVSVVGEVWR